MNTRPLPRPSALLRRLTFNLLFSGFAGARLLAVSPVPYTEGVTFSFQEAGGVTQPAYLSVYDEMAALNSANTPISTWASGSGNESVPTTAWLIPGKSYTATFTASSLTQYTMSLIAPDGFEVLVDGVSTTTYPSPIYGSPVTFNDTHTLEIRPLANPDKIAGSFSGIMLGKAITWGVNLGGLHSGNTAGQIFFRELDLTDSPPSNDIPASRDRLVYVAPVYPTAPVATSPQVTGTITGQVNVYWDSLTKLRQVAAPQAIADLQDDTGGTGYTINFYTFAQGTYVSSTTPYTLTGSPWKTIHVQSLSAGQLTITDTEGSVSRVSVLTLTSGTVTTGTYELTLQEGDGTNWLRTTQHSSTNNGDGTRDDIATVQTGGSTGTVVAKTKYHYISELWGEEVQQVITDPDSAQLTTTYTYGTNGSQLGNYRRLQSIVDPTGNWTMNIYYDDWNRRGMLESSLKPYGNTPATPSTDVTQGLVTTYDYGPDWTGKYTEPISQITTVNGNMVGHQTWTYDSADTPTFGLLRIEATVASSVSASVALSSRIEYVSAQNSSPDETDAPYLTKKPDQSQISQSRSAGSYSSGTFTATPTATNLMGTYWRELMISGSTSSSGGELQSSYNGQSFDPIYLVPNVSTMIATIRDPSGNVLATTNYAYQSGGSWATLNSSTYTYDQAGRLAQSTASNGATATNTITNGYLTKAIDSAGTETDYTYDAIGRVLTSVKKGVAASGTYAAQPDLTTTTTYDGANHALSQVLSSSGAGETITNTSLFDLSGRLVSQTPAGLGTTTYAYNITNRTTTSTAPDSGTTIKTANLDGQTSSITGTAVVARYYVYGYDSSASQPYSQVLSGSSSSARMQQTWVDWLGRTSKTLRPGFSETSQANYVESNSYDPTTGLLTQKSRTGYANTLYVYDTLGNMIRSGLDINANGTLDLTSSDRITDQNTVFHSDSSSNWWTQTTTISYPVSGASTAVTTAITRDRLTGFSGNIQAEQQAVDAEGNLTDTVTSVAPSSQLVTVSTTSPGLINAKATVSYNGLGVSQTGYDNLTASQQFDNLDRKWKATDSRGNTTVMLYITGTTMPLSVTDAAGDVVSTYSYDGNGRVLTTENALGKYTRNLYDTLGRITNQWGATTYPVSYTYDPIFGDKLTMSTYRNAPAADSTTWPSVGSPDTTTWIYDAPTGLLWKKTDATGAFVQFNYNSNGQMLSRQLARALVNSSGNVTATYAYDSNTGELLTTSYNDSGEAIPTPEVTYTYTRLGQKGTISDAAGTRTFNYDSTYPWRMDSESLPSYFNSRQISRLYESATNTSAGTFGTYSTGTVKGRAVGFEIGTSGAPTQDLQQSYAFDNLGQFVGTTSQVGTNAAEAFTYSYIANSELVNGYTAGSNFALTRSYESQRNLVTKINTSWGSTTLSEFDFTYDPLYRRQTNELTGTAYADYFTGMSYSAVYNVYNYDDRSQLQTSAMYRGNTPTTSPASGDELPGRRFEYRFDSIGNRNTAGETGSASTGDETYTANALNQHTAKENNTVRVIGTAASSANVAVGGAPSTGKTDRAWGADLLAANSASAVQGTATVYAGLPGAGTGGLDIIKTLTKSYFIPPAVQNFTYDLDGNLTSDGVWNYTYDAENRLVQASSALASGQGFTRLKLNFAYDYLGRRIQKLVTNIDTSTQTLARRFIYDGWNLIEELDGAGANLQRAYVWGLDLTGDLARAGGVGALVQLYDYASSETFWPTYDSNGNVASLVNASTGAFGAVYEYDPFGNYLRTDLSDTAIQDNPWRFNSKYTDLENNLVYYGHRFYSAQYGRFINRDPIQEMGGLNLYAYCANDSINHYDVLGQDGDDGDDGDDGGDFPSPGSPNPSDPFSGGSGTNGNSGITIGIGYSGGGSSGSGSGSTNSGSAGSGGSSSQQSTLPADGIPIYGTSGGADIGALALGTTPVQFNQYTGAYTEVDPFVGIPKSANGVIFQYINISFNVSNSNGTVATATDQEQGDSFTSQFEQWTVMGGVVGTYDSYGAFEKLSTYGETIGGVTGDIFNLPAWNTSNLKVGSTITITTSMIYVPVVNLPNNVDLTKPLPNWYQAPNGNPSGDLWIKKIFVGWPGPQNALNRQLQLTLANQNGELVWQITNGGDTIYEGLNNQGAVAGTVNTTKESSDPFIPPLANTTAPAPSPPPSTGGILLQRPSPFKYEGKGK